MKTKTHITKKKTMAKTHIHTHTYYPVILAEISAKKSKNWKKWKQETTVGCCLELRSCFLTFFFSLSVLPVIGSFTDWIQNLSTIVSACRVPFAWKVRRLSTVPSLLFSPFEFVPLTRFFFVWFISALHFYVLKPLWGNYH